MRISSKKRKIGYTYGSVSGRYPFRKQKSITFESLLEKDFLSFCDFNTSVEDIIEQPLTIEYMNKKGKDTKYTPDFLVSFKHIRSNKIYTDCKYENSELKTKSLLVEIKPYEKLKKQFHIYKERFKIASNYAQENDMEFRIFTERNIYGDYFDNIMLIKRHEKSNYPQDDVERVFEYIEYMGSVTIDQVLVRLFFTKEAKGIGLGLIYNMLFNKYILTNFTEPITMFSELFVNDEREEF